jgi:hypothetical protein
MRPCFWVLHDVRSQFTDDVSEPLFGPIFTGQMNKNFCPFGQQRWDPKGVPKRRR